MRLGRLVVLLTAAAALVAPVGAAAATVELHAPEVVEVGRPVEVALDLRRAGRVGAYEAVVRFDHRRARLLGIRQLGRGAGGARALGPVRSGHREAFGTYGCRGSGCGGDRRLATLELRPRRRGVLRIDVLRLTTTNNAGRRIASIERMRPLALRVERRRSTRVRARVRAALSDRSRVRRPRSTDVTNDGTVDAADVAALALAWSAAPRGGRTCARPAIDAHDVNRDGCLDATDVQRVAADARTTPPAVPVPAPPPRGPVPEPVPPAPEPVPPAPEPQPSFVVTGTGDGADATLDGVCAAADGSCTLRAAISEANARTGADSIAFGIPGDGVHTIRIESALPAVNDPSGPTTIDGLTQPGAAPNADPVAFDARLRIEVAGPGGAAADCFTLLSPGNVLRGIAVYDCRRAVVLFGPDARDNRLVSNHIGTNAAGTFAGEGALTGAGIGVMLEQGASANHVGEASPSGRNVISGNARTGILAYNEGTRGNRVVNAIVGLSPSGDRRLSNRTHGIDLNAGTSHTVIGGSGPFERNVISGNGDHEDTSNFTAGVEVSHGTTTTGTRILGNLIGTDLTGDSAPAYAHNGHYGIRLEDAVNDIDVTGNVLVNNRSGGIKVDGAGTTGVRIADNRIGLTAAGTPAPNGAFGVLLRTGASQVRVGPRNVIAYNPIGIAAGEPTTDRNTFTRNSIFANTGLGIDLDPLFGVNSNDVGDADDGPNEQLDFPVLEGATSGVVTGTSCSGCTVEVFVAEPDPSGHGEGRDFAGSGTVGADGRFTVTSTAIPAGATVTATATDPAGNTSEFARTIPAH